MKFIRINSFLINLDNVTSINISDDNLMIFSFEKDDELYVECPSNQTMEAMRGNILKATGLDKPILPPPPTPPNNKA